jgi:hypothetical protein
VGNNQSTGSNKSTNREVTRSHEQLIHDLYFGSKELFESKLHLLSSAEEVYNAIIQKKL